MQPSHETEEVAFAQRAVAGREPSADGVIIVALQEEIEERFHALWSNDSILDSWAIDELGVEMAIVQSPCSLIVCFRHFCKVKNAGALRRVMLYRSRLRFIDIFAQKKNRHKHTL